MKNEAIAGNTNTYPDLKTLLKNEFQKRMDANPRYSLRAFARTLGISPASLSNVLTGKRVLAEKSVKKVSEILKLKPSIIQQVLEHEMRIRVQKNTPLILDRSNEYQDISLENFEIIAKWYHFAILSLLEIKDSQLDAKWISERLGITETEAQEAIERLVSLNIVGLKDGKWKQIGMPLKLDNKDSTAATKEFGVGINKKSIESMLNDPFDVRDHTGMMMAIAPELIPIAKEKIKIFKRELSHFLEKNGPPEKVYYLSLHLFPVSKDPK